MNSQQQLAYIELNYSLVLLLRKYNLNYKKTSKGWSTKAIWRGGNGYNVHIYSKTNSFFDFVTKESGGFFKLFCLINDIKPSIKNLNVLINDLNINRLDLSQIDGNEINLAIKKRRKEIIAFQKEEELKQEELKKIAQVNINKLFYASKPVKNNDYFVSKGISLSKDFHFINNIKEIYFDQKTQAYFLENKLSKQKIYDYHYHCAMIVPIFHVETNEIISLQYFKDEKTVLDVINKTGFELKMKEFHKNTSPHLGVYIINESNNLINNNLIVLCEGIATGLSIYKCINKNVDINIPVVCCFTANNLKNVVDYFKNKNKIVVVASDRDTPILRNNQIYNLYGAGLNIMNQYATNGNILFTTPSFNLKNDKAILFFNRLTNEYLKITDINDTRLNLLSDFNDFNNLNGDKATQKIFWFNLVNYIIRNNINIQGIMNCLCENNQSILKKYYNRMTKILQNRNFDVFRTTIIEVDNFDNLFDKLNYSNYNNQNNSSSSEYIKLKHEIINLGLEIQKRKNNEN